MTISYRELLHDMQPENFDKLEVLLEPVEWLEIGNGSEANFTVINFKLGKTEIRPRYDPNKVKKWVAAIRLYCEPSQKPNGVPWWDVDAKGLIAQLLPMLGELKGKKKRIRITASGFGGAKRYSVSLF